MQAIVDIIFWDFFDTSPNIVFTRSETNRDYLQKTWYIGVDSEVVKRLPMPEN